MPVSRQIHSSIFLHNHLSPLQMQSKAKCATNISLYHTAHIYMHKVWGEAVFTDTECPQADLHTHDQCLCLAIPLQNETITIQINN